MMTYENVKIELLTLTGEDIISTSYPLGDEGTETPILPSRGSSTSASDSPGIAGNY